MNALPDCHGIIPARYASTRFPGKPLAMILDKPMFQWVYERASACPEMKSVTLATDDERIEREAREAGVPVVMTRADHASGTDRVLEAARALGLSDQAVVVNIQGDEPALDPAMLSLLVAPFASPEVEAATLARRLDAAEADNPDRVKVVVSASGRALYFSRSRIPFDRDGGDAGFLLHVGLYAFTMRTLERFAAWPVSALEKRERLEQLRLLENDVDMRVSVTEHACLGVDRPGDVDAVEKMLLETIK